jgi:hypothetical protein
MKKAQKPAGLAASRPGTAFIDHRDEDRLSRRPISTGRPVCDAFRQVSGSF